MSAMVFSSDPSNGCVPSFKVRAVQITLPPSAANTLAMSAPIPRLAPVTMATLPSSLPMHSSLSDARKTLATSWTCNASRFGSPRPAQAWVERVADAVPQQVERQDCDGNGEPWEEHQPPVRHQRRQ